MNKKMMLALSMVFVMMFGVCGMAFARGGGPDPAACEETYPILPPPDAGFFLRGEFTVSFYPDLLAGDQNVVHIFLKKGNQTELFMIVSAAENLCDPNLTIAKLIDRFKYAPCKLGVAERFLLDGVGVITNMEILQSDCTTIDQMMRGEIVIRVVPPTPAVK